MKLYATTTSERATKGQGGNKKIEINLQIDGEKRLEIGNLIMTCENDFYEVYYYPINENCQEQKLNSGRVLLYQTTKNPCPHNTTSFKNFGICNDCGKDFSKTKGKKQRDEEKCANCGKDLKNHPSICQTSFK